MPIPVLDTSAWAKKLFSLHPVGTENVTAFYEHRIGAICHDPHMLLVPLNDHLVHRGDGIFESLTFLDGRIVQLDAHLKRLQHSASVLNLMPPCPWNDIRAIALEVAVPAANPAEDSKYFWAEVAARLEWIPPNARKAASMLSQHAAALCPNPFGKRGSPQRQAPSPPNSLGWRRSSPPTIWPMRSWPEKHAKKA